MPEGPRISKFRRRLLDLAHIEEGEVRPTLLLAGFLLFGLATVICLKAVSDAVFLSEFEAHRLPWVDLTVTVLVGLVVNYYLRWSNRTALPSAIAATQIFLVVNLLIFWLLVHLEVAFAAVLIYVWVGVFAVLIPSQVWSLAATTFTTRQAKRVYAFIGSGGILGAALAGSFTAFAVPRIGAEMMWPVSIACVVLSAWMAHQVGVGGSRPAPAAEPAEVRSEPALLESLRLVRSNRYLLLIAVAIFLSTIAGTLVKYQFKAIAQIEFAGDRDALASFSGSFYGYIAALSFLFHTLLTGRLLRRIGLNWCLLVLPVALAGGMTGLLFSSSIIAAILARATDQGMRHSIDRASIELLYVPTPEAVRNRVKSFLDMVVSRVADGAASLILLILLAALGASAVNQISVAGLIVVAAWLIALWRLRIEYVRTLRATIERPDISADALLARLAAAGPSSELENYLTSSDPRDVEAAVGWVRVAGAGAAQAHLASLLTNGSPMIRRKAMHAVRDRAVPGCEGKTLDYLQLETDPDERWIALSYLEQQAEERRDEIFAELIQGGEPELAALAAAKALHWEGPLGAEAMAAFSSFQRQAHGGDRRMRAVAARIIGLAPPRTCPLEDLEKYLDDSEPLVVQAAVRSAGQSGQPELAGKLLALLSQRRHARDVLRALASYGEALVETLSETLRNSRDDHRIQRQVARVLGSIGGNKAALTLLAYLHRSGHAAREEALRSLTRIRRREPELQFDPKRVERLLEAALESYYSTAVLLESCNSEGSASAFLRRAVSERLKSYQHELFTLLSLTYPQREILDALARIESGRKELRANAVEFLDSRLLGRPLRPRLIPALEGLPQGVAAAAKRLYRLRPAPYPSVLQQLLDRPDSWIQSCACAAAAEAERVELKPQIDALLRHPDPLLRETAQASSAHLQALGGSPAATN